MPFDSNAVQGKIDEIGAKILRLESKIHELVKIKNQLKTIVDKTDIERNLDGSIKFNEFGEKIDIIIKPVDEYTGEELTDERRNTIKDALFAKEALIDSS